MKRNWSALVLGALMSVSLFGSVGCSKDEKNQLPDLEKEIKEIENIQKRLEEINALEEEERKKIIRFEALPISNYTKQGIFIGSM